MWMPQNRSWQNKMLNSIISEHSRGPLQLCSLRTKTDLPVLKYKTSWCFTRKLVKSLTQTSILSCPFSSFECYFYNNKRIASNTNHSVISNNMNLFLWTLYMISVIGTGKWLDSRGSTIGKGRYFSLRYQGKASSSYRIGTAVLYPRLKRM